MVPYIVNEMYPHISLRERGKWLHVQILVYVIIEINVASTKQEVVRIT